MLSEISSFFNPLSSKLRLEIIRFSCPVVSVVFPPGLFSLAEKFKSTADSAWGTNLGYEFSATVLIVSGSCTTIKHGKATNVKQYITIAKPY